MLFDLAAEPHEQHNLARKRPEIVNFAMRYLDEWTGDVMRTATTGADPIWEVMSEGGAFHTSGKLSAYLIRLRDTGRADAADRLVSKHAPDLT